MQRMNETRPLTPCKTLKRLEVHKIDAILGPTELYSSEFGNYPMSDWKFA